MRAAFYEQNGPARDGAQARRGRDAEPGPGEVRVKLATSGVNPSDVKARSGSTRKIAYPRVIPHSDGAGEIDMVGDGVPATRVGERVWVWNAQWKRAFGTCAEYVALPAEQAVRLPDKTSFAAGACLGIPAMTAYHAVAVAGAEHGRDAVSYPAAPAPSAITRSNLPRRRRHRHHDRQLAGKGERRAASGADHTIDYKRENVGERVMAITDKKGVDAIIEMDIAANAKLIPRSCARTVKSSSTAPARRKPRCRYFSSCATPSGCNSFIVYELDCRQNEPPHSQCICARARSRHAHHQCRRHVSAREDCRRT